MSDEIIQLKRTIPKCRVMTVPCGVKSGKSYLIIWKLLEERLERANQILK